MSNMSSDCRDIESQQRDLLIGGDRPRNIWRRIFLVQHACQILRACKTKRGSLSIATAAVSSSTTSYYAVIGTCKEENAVSSLIILKPGLDWPVESEGRSVCSRLRLKLVLAFGAVRHGDGLSRGSLNEPVMLVDQPVPRLVAVRILQIMLTHQMKRLHDMAQDLLGHVMSVFNGLTHVLLWVSILNYNILIFFMYN